MLSPSPSPQAASVDSSSQQFYSTATSDMLQHPQAQMHPSLLYHSPSPAFDSSSSYNGNPMAHLPPSESPPPGGAGKRYRSAPAKTFQCAGYGECRMVFSRSEHLARHIRKHTGERPFACHCTKQFSRLDNLRQHAQTVHSAPEDKPLNERMMRALAGVNASMMAGVRGRRRYGGDSSSPHCTSSSPLPSPPYSSGSASFYAQQQHPSFPAGAFASSSSSSPSSGSVSPPFASPALSSDYASVYDGSPLPSPSFGAFPGSSSSSASPYSYQQQQQQQQFHHGSPYESPAADYLSHAPIRVKQEQTELDLDGFYAALEGPSVLPPSSLSHYSSSASLSSLASASSSSSSSSASSDRPDTAQPPRPVRGYTGGSASGSSNSSPSGSPCVPTFWAGSQQQQQQQQQGREYLPSPPQSPSYYATSHPHPHHSHAHAQGRGPFGWTIPPSPEEDAQEEMSNAQYYAALQQQHPHHSHHSPPALSPHGHPHGHHAQDGYFYGHAQAGQQGYAVFA